MDPISAMEPASSVTIPKGDEWVAQIKWDGVRILTYLNETGEIRLFNRRKNERTLHFPELLDIQSYCSAHSVILDGEVIALGEDGWPSFQEVMKRDGIRRLERVEMIKKDVPVTYMIFDVVYLDGQWTNDLPFSERSAILENIILPKENIQLVPSVREADALFKSIKDFGMEGIIMKQINSPYVFGKKKDYWLKIKNYQDLIAVVGGFTVGSNAVVNSILLGLYNDEGRFLYIGHTGTGKMTNQDWKELTRELSRILQSDMPFSNLPERRSGSFWVTPKKTVKIKFAEWTEAGFLRQPSIESFIEIDPRECKFEK